MARLPLPIALLVLATACGGATTAHTGSATPVPWVDRPLPLYMTPEPRLIRYPTSAPPCRSSNIRVSKGRVGVATGNRLEELVFTNTGSSPCLLRGYPTVRAEGGRVVLRPRRSTFFGRLVPSDLSAGGHVFLDFGTSDCGCRCERSNPVTYDHLVFGLPQGGKVRADGISLTKDCFLDMSAFGLQARYGQPRAEPGTPGTLEARLELPPAVRAGETLRYVVMLSNPTVTAVALDPCPGYTEGIYSPAAPGERRSIALNCDSVPEIPAHDSVQFEMRLEVPSGAAEVAKVGWSLNTPTGPFAGGAIRITSG